MPFRSIFTVKQPPEITVDADDVLIAVPTGERRFRFTVSHYNARVFAVRLLNELNIADRERRGRVLPFKSVDDGG